MSLSGTRRSFLGLTALLLAAPSGGAGQTGTFPDVSIARSDLRIRSIAIDVGTLTYRYEVVNPASSNAGVASVALDVSATRLLRPGMLATTGFFLGDGTRTAVDAVVGHVPIGMDIPSDWGGQVSAQGFAEWYARGPGLTATRPVPAGGQNDEFVLRSTYLPGIRLFRLLPEYPFICCAFPVGDPRNDTSHVKSAFDFRMEGSTIVPRYAPEEVSLGLLADLESQVCTLEWISSDGVCHSLQVKLDQARLALSQGRTESAKGQLGAFVEELAAQHGPEPGKHVNDNAYWLLKVNAEFLAARLP
jgi:FIMAH domain-containing protein